MTGATGALGHLAMFLIAGGVTATLALGLPRARHAARRALDAHASSLDAECAFSRLPVRGATVARGQLVALAAVLPLAWATGIWPLAGLGVSALVAPRLWLERRRAARVLALEEQLADWLVSVSSALQAGNAIAEALAASAEVVGAPMRDEIQQSLRELSLGAPLDEALHRLGARVRSRSLQSAIFILAMGRETGGDLPATLERAAGSLREMARLEGVVRTKTAEGKAQALVISVIPAPLVATIEWVQPGYFAPLTASGTGYAISAGAGALWAVAITLASRIVAVEI